MLQRPFIVIDAARAVPRSSGAREGGAAVTQRLDRLDELAAVRADHVIVHALTHRQPRRLKC